MFIFSDDHKLQRTAKLFKSKRLQKLFWLKNVDKDLAFQIQKNSNVNYFIHDF